MDDDDTIPIGLPQHGLRAKTYAFVEKETTIETSFSFAYVSISALKSGKNMKKLKAKYTKVVFVFSLNFK